MISLFNDLISLCNLLINIRPENQSGCPLVSFNRLSLGCVTSPMRQSDHVAGFKCYLKSAATSRSPTTANVNLHLFLCEYKFNVTHATCVFVYVCVYRYLCVCA